MAMTGLAEEVKAILDKSTKKGGGTEERKLSKKEKQLLELASEVVLPEHYRLVWTNKDLDELVSWAAGKEILAVDTETTSLDWTTADIVGISIAADDYGWYIPLKHALHSDFVDDLDVGVRAVRCLPKTLVKDKLEPILTQKKLVLHNAKYDAHILRQTMGIVIDPYVDTLIAAKLLDENQSGSLKDLARHYLKIEADKFSALFEKVTFDRVPILMDPATRTGSLAGYYAIKDAEMTYKLWQFFSNALERLSLSRLKSLLFDVEMPFLKIVIDAEARGVKLDTEYLEREIKPQLAKEIEELEEKIKKYVGDININSPAQLSVALYDNLKLPKVNPKAPKSTDRRTLQKLKSKHEVIPLILQYREKVKLMTAFVDKLPKAVVNGRVHTQFNTIGAKTGRMSSNEPNLQQIPKGGHIRNAFVADEGRLLASIDFSQQELRLLAHMSKDPVLINLYKEGKDVHSMTALGMWNMQHEPKLTYEQFEAIRGLLGKITDADGNFDPSKVTDEKIYPLKEAGLSTDNLHDLVLIAHQLEKTRSMAKTINFGIIYGMGPQKLADSLDITLEEAEQYIESYFQNYPRVRQWMAEQREKIRTQMYTETILGRKRRVYPEVKSGEKWLLERAYRMGINAVIQGSGADMVKVASIKLQPLLKELDAHIILWVHDEIIFDVPDTIGMRDLQRIADVMANAIPIDAGMSCDIEVGKRWGQKISSEDLTAFFEEVEQ